MGVRGGRYWDTSAENARDLRRSSGDGFSESGSQVAIMLPIRAKSAQSSGPAITWHGSFAAAPEWRRLGELAIVPEMGCSARLRKAMSGPAHGVFKPSPFFTASSPSACRRRRSSRGDTRRAHALYWCKGYKV